MVTKILIADVHPYARAGIRTILDGQPGFSVVGEAQDGLEALEKTRSLQPDLVIIEISMPKLSGIEAAKQILEEQPDVKIIALSLHSDDRFVKDMLNAGVVGYILKEEGPEVLIRAIDKIIQGDIYLSSGVTRGALEGSDEKSGSVTVKVYSTKLKRPPVHHYLHRERISEELERNISKPLSLISAGAGYGKSVAVSQWLEQTDRFYAWISLDEEQDDLRIFLTYLISAMERIHAGSMETSINAISGIQLPPLKELFCIILNDLCEIEEDTILVLDDYHKIHQEEIHQFFNDWLRLPPTAIHLTIITRRDPPLNINPLRIAGRLLKLRMDKLSFSPEEIKALFKQVKGIDLSNEALNYLDKKTEGWVLALTLASMVIDNNEDVSSLIGNFEGRVNTITDYLISEVLSRQPEELHGALLASSILNRFCSAVIDVVCPKRIDLNGDKFIKFLRSANLFIIELDNEKKWFRYHHLFQSLLQAQLTSRVSKEEINKYHLSASSWFEKSGFIKEAMDHALIPGQYALAAEIIKRNRLDLLNSNDYYLLERLQSKLSLSLIESDPELILIEMYIQFNHQNFARLGELEKMMMNHIGKVEIGSPVRAELNLFQGYNSLFIRDDLPSGLKYFEQGMEDVAESSSEPRGLVELMYMIFGQFTGLYEKIRKLHSRLIAEDLAPIRKCRVYQGFLIASINQGELDEVQANYRNAIAYSRNAKMKNALGLLLYSSGSMMLSKGKWIKAAELFDEVLSIKYLVHSRVVVDSMTGLIIINSLKHEKHKAKELIAILETYAKGVGDYLNIYVWSCKMRHHLINGDYNAVVELMSVYKPGLIALMWMDVPHITYIEALVFEGTQRHLDEAEKELTTLEMTVVRLHNLPHLLEVKILQAILYQKKGEFKKSEEAFMKSVEIAEPRRMMSFYIELGEMFITTIKSMPGNIHESPFIIRIKKEIEKLSKLRVVNIPKKTKEKIGILTPRELEILQCISEGLRNKEIADKLYNSEKTIKKHIYNMFIKMNVKNRLSLVTKAQQEGILLE